MFPPKSGGMVINPYSCTQTLEVNGGDWDRHRIGLQNLPSKIGSCQARMFKTDPPKKWSMTLKIGTSYWSTGDFSVGQPQLGGFRHGRMPSTPSTVCPAALQTEGSGNPPGNTGFTKVSFSPALGEALAPLRHAPNMAVPRSTAGSSGRLFWSPNSAAEFYDFHPPETFKWNTTKKCSNDVEIQY